jgi:hypothetical protein
MRALALRALAVATFASAAQAQQAVDSTHGPQMDGRLRMEIGVIRSLFASVHAPDADSFVVGNQDVPAGVTRSGTVAVARGNLEVHGRVAGDAIALHGDVLVYPGGGVGRNAIAIDGRVRTLGGVVEGDVRSIRGVTGGLLARAGGMGTTVEPVTTFGAVKIVLGWFAVLFAIAIGVLLFAEKNLDEVVGALEQQFAKSFWTGVLAQLAILPVLAVAVVGLALSIIGILLVPFAVVAYIVALAGLVTLGFIAVARFTGRAFSSRTGSSRAVSLRSLFIGLVIYVGLWMAAAAFNWSPIAGSMLHAVALAGSWVALTFGLGATILTRAGTKREGERARRAQTPDDLSWQTPTPVTGVVAARRPVAAVKTS